MNRSSIPQPPVLADSRARLCLVLNALILPGLGTYREGSRVRGVVEMSLALGGCFWVLVRLLAVGWGVIEDGDIVAAFSAQTGGLLMGLGVAGLAWISGFQFSWIRWKKGVPAPV